MLYRWTRWLLATAVAATVLWIGGGLWILASPSEDASAADELAVEDIRAELRELTSRIAELSSTVEWLESREPLSGERVDELSARLDDAFAMLVELTAAPEPEPTPYPLSTNGEDLYSCASFDSGEEAQAVYEANLPGDPNHIDTDNDGIACEKLQAR